MNYEQEAERENLKQPSDVLPPERLYHVNLPKQHCQLGTECSGTRAYGGHYTFNNHPVVSMQLTWVWWWCHESQAPVLQRGQKSSRLGFRQCWGSSLPQPLRWACTRPGDIQLSEVMPALVKSLSQDRDKAQRRLAEVDQGESVSGLPPVLGCSCRWYF